MQGASVAAALHHQRNGASTSLAVQQGPSLTSPPPPPGSSIVHGPPCRDAWQTGRVSLSRTVVRRRPDMFPCSRKALALACSSVAALPNNRLCGTLQWGALSSEAANACPNTDLEGSAVASRYRKMACCQYCRCLVAEGSGAWWSFLDD